MAGGLIDIISYGSQGLYLTANPTITFFKTVYRRHTNFSSESIPVSFDDIIKFNGKGVATVPLAGHLIHKTYLQLIVPRIELFTKRCDNLNDKNLDGESGIINDIKTVKTFMNFNRDAYVSAIGVCTAKNIQSIKKVVDAIIVAFKECDNTVIELCKDIIPTTTNYAYEQISLLNVANSINCDGGVTVDEFACLLNLMMEKSNRIYKQYVDIERRYLIDKCDRNDDRVKFAWTKRLGHAIIDEVEVKIGGEKIDKHYGVWLDIWYELTANRNLDELYDEMIGNIDVLTGFNKVAKPEYKLNIPLQFWFCRFSGSALPLCCLENSDVTVHIKIKKLHEVAKVEECVDILYNDELISFEEYSDKINVDLQAKLLIDFIYLERDELRRFATSNNEYLIEQLQREQFYDVTANKTVVSFETFCNPTKELIFTVQDKYDLNYGLYNNKVNPVKSASILFDNYIRVIEMEGGYYNYVQPREHHTSTPKDGINVYSFSLHPEEFQPTGSVNLSRMKRVGLDIEFVDKEKHSYIVTGYTRSMNILRFIGGSAGLAFNWG